MQAREFRRHHRSMDCRSLRLNYAVAASRVTSSVSRKLRSCERLRAHRSIALAAVRLVGQPIRNVTIQLTDT